MKKLYLLSLLSISLFLTACGQQQGVNNTQNNQTTQKQNIEQQGKQTIQKQEIKQQNVQIEKNPQVQVNQGQVNPRQWNQAPAWWPSQKVLEAVKKIKDVKECDKLFKKKEDLLLCKRNYIIKNADKLDEKVFDNIKDEKEQKLCKSFFESRKKWETLTWWPNQKVLEAVKKIKDVKECDKMFKTKKDILDCKREYIIKNADKLDEKVCDNIKDEKEQKLCKSFFKNKKK